MCRKAKIFVLRAYSSYKNVRIHAGISRHKRIGMKLFDKCMTESTKEGTDIEIRNSSTQCYVVYGLVFTSGTVIMLLRFALNKIPYVNSLWTKKHNSLQLEHK